MRYFFEQEAYIEDDLEGFNEAEGEIECELEVTVCEEFQERGEG